MKCSPLFNLDITPFPPSQTALYSWYLDLRTSIWFFCLCCFSLVQWAPDTLPAQLSSPVPEVHLKKSFILPPPHSLHLPSLPPPLLHLVPGLSTLARALPASTSLDGKNQKEPSTQWDLWTQESKNSFASLNDLLLAWWRTEVIEKTGGVQRTKWKGLSFTK